MTDDSQQRRRFQFSLRGMMLWITTVAVSLSVLKTLRLEFSVGGVVVTLWIAVVGAVRATLGPAEAAILSLLGGATVAACIPAMVPASELLMPVVLTSGFIPFLVVEATWRIVNWADNLIRTKTDN
jgi:hypothetical protein